MARCKTQPEPLRSTPILRSRRWSCPFFTGRARETRARPRDFPRSKKNRRLLRRLKYPRPINDLNVDYFLLQLITVFPFPVGRHPRFSRSMHFGDVSDTNGPRDPTSSLWCGHLSLSITWGLTIFLYFFGFRKTHTYSLKQTVTLLWVNWSVTMTRTPPQMTSLLPPL